MINHFLNGFNPPKDATGIFKMPSGDLLASFPRLSRSGQQLQCLPNAEQRQRLISKSRATKWLNETDFEPFVPARNDGKSGERAGTAN